MLIYVMIFIILMLFSKQPAGNQRSAYRWPWCPRAPCWWPQA